ncbi:MAG: FkbM family methyltransferase [Cytophagales bacterium]|nr:FkbM family methyltransferase [Cytophagales bacterium]
MHRLLKLILGSHLYLILTDIFTIPAQKADTARRAKFYAQFVPHGALCFDVGANLGNRISPLLHIGARVLAVEPQASCIKFLKYKFGKKIILVPMGLGNEETVKTLHISNASTISSVSEEWIAEVKKNRFKNYTWNKTQNITITTLHTLIVKYGHPHFIKIDVEGYELQVLQGLHSQVPIISFEYTVPEQTLRVQQCIDQIVSLGGQYVCNYSIGESMEWALDQWISVDDMKKHILSSAFISTQFGDVYLKNIDMI